MRLGINVPNFGPAATPASFRSWIEFAEEAGFSVAMMSDHVAPTPDVTAIYPVPFYDPFATLSWLAAFTTHLTLGTSVAIVPYRHPLLTARMSANLDQFTAGRFVLGVGVGWSQMEFAALGVSFAERGRITDEFLAVITRAWAEPSVAYEGDHVRFQDVATGPAPARQPRPPLWVGGIGKAALERAARFGDAWHPVNPERGWLQDGAFPALARAAAHLRTPTPSFCPRIKARLTSHDLTGQERPLGVGSLAQIATTSTCSTPSAPTSSSSTPIQTTPIVADRRSPTGTHCERSPSAPPTSWRPSTDRARQTAAGTLRT